MIELNEVPRLSRIFTPSSYVVSPPGTLGNSMLESENLGFTTVTHLQSLGETLVFTHVP